MNPYEVLGVRENADEETIKRAYRELVKKYHPDKYVNNPLADLANEKIKQVNEAYDIITSGRSVKTNKNRQSAASRGGAASQNGAGTNKSYSSEATFANVRALIRQKSFSAAETMLVRLPRCAEWYYLSGVLNMNRGWYIQARSDIMRAVQMDPDNEEYRAALGTMQKNTGGYRSYNTQIHHNDSQNSCIGYDSSGKCMTAACVGCYLGIRFCL